MSWCDLDYGPQFALKVSFPGLLGTDISNAIFDFIAFLFLPPQVALVVQVLSRLQDQVGATVALPPNL